MGEGATAAAAGGFGSQAAEPGTPKTTVDGWNSDGEVSWLVVSDDLTCGARLGAEGDLDFIACGRSTAGCSTSSHKQKEVKRLAFPLTNGQALAIQVPRSSPTVKTRIFSHPLLPFADIPQ